MIFVVTDSFSSPGPRQIELKAKRLGMLIAIPASMKSISVSIEVCQELAAITGWRRTRSLNNEGCPFAFLFECMLIDYPKILECYPPETGLLAFTINGIPPDDFGYALKDKDRVCFWIQRNILAFH